MKWACLSILALGALGGCSDEATYHPHAQPSALDPQAPKKGIEPGSADVVAKVDDVDCTPYAVPIYPGAKVLGASEVEKQEAGSGKELHITFESYDQVSPISEWYRDRINPTSAYVIKDELGTLEGKTSTGYGVKISVAKVDAKSAIAVTVDETQKK